jgi:pimeloyl-ACP methyl ester carboxylesterase
MRDQNKIKTHSQIVFKTITVDNVDIFYREAGPADAPIIVLLHGFPSSSHMYRDLISFLAPDFHVIAPDYPGFGLSSCPPPEKFDYTFDHIAGIMEHFLDQLGLSSFSLYMQDYGGPIGFRIACKRPSAINSLIIQNANIYMDGLGPDVQKIGALEKSGDMNGLHAAIQYMLSAPGVKEQYMHGAYDTARVSPDAYLMDSFLMERNGVKNIQSMLFQNYPVNFSKYPEWQSYLRTNQPPALIVWGKNDKIFTAPGAEAYLKDLQNPELHLLDGGHFMLEEYSGHVASLIKAFFLKYTIR